MMIETGPSKTPSPALSTSHSRGNSPASTDALIHLPKATIRASAVHLAEACPCLQFPLPTNSRSFPDHDTFRIHATAAAIQRDFRLVLGGEKDSPTRFTLMCSLGHSRFRYTVGGKCGFWMRVERGEEGWRCITVSGGHNHEVVEDDVEGNMVLGEVDEAGQETDELEEEARERIATEKREREERNTAKGKGREIERVEEPPPPVHQQRRENAARGWRELPHPGAARARSAAL
ncbi:hypothetical protein P7C70_g3125, partial [Phenoliferia sp. Uapishka_3]